MKIVRILTVCALAAACGSAAAGTTRTRIYVANSSANDISVIDLGTRKVVADSVGEHVHGTCAPADGSSPTHGLALSPNGKTLWVTSLAEDNHR